MVVKRKTLTKTIKVRGKIYKQFSAGQIVNGRGFINLTSANNFCSTLRKKVNLNCQIVEVGGSFYTFVREKKRGK